MYNQVGEFLRALCILSAMTVLPKHFVELLETSTNVQHGAVKEMNFLNRF